MPPPLAQKVKSARQNRTEDAPKYHDHTFDPQSEPDQVLRSWLDNHGGIVLPVNRQSLIARVRNSSESGAKPSHYYCTHIRVHAYKHVTMCTILYNTQTQLANIQQNNDLFSSVAKLLSRA